MPTLRTATAQNHHVSVTYGDGAHTFSLAQETTLGELAVRISSLGTLHAGRPLTIDVIVETLRQPMAATDITPTAH